VIFWSENALWIAKRPENIARTDDWPLTKIYSYGTISQMQQQTLGTELEVAKVNHHEGITVIDMNLDGKENIVAGGMWFNYQDQVFQPNPIDLSYVGGRMAVGQIDPGAWPEVVMSPGLGVGPIIMYKFDRGSWKQTIIQKSARRVRSIQIIDFNKDGHADIVAGEMRTNEVSDPKVFVLFNDGNGNFTRMDVDNGKGAHGLWAADIDGDGDFDLVGKPYSYGAPRVDIWLNEGER
jgi:hypothetical protein